MSQTEPKDFIICFRSIGNILHSFDGTHNALDIREVKNFSAEIFVKYLAAMLQIYVESFYNHYDICVDYEYTLKKHTDVDIRLEAPLFLNVGSSELASSIIDELRSVAGFGLSLTQDSSDIFGASNDINLLSKDKKEFVEEFARGFLEKHGGKNISKPFEWTVSGHNDSFTPFQGRIKPSVINNEIDKSDFIMQAKLDGFKNSEMLIYLQEIDSELNLHPASITCKAVKPSLLKSAAEIYFNSSPAYVNVTAFKKADEKGIVRFHLRDIVSFQFDELTELSVSS